MASTKEQITNLQNAIRNLMFQPDSGGDLQQQLLAMQTELANLEARAAKPKLYVVPAPAPLAAPPNLVGGEQTVWNTFYQYHTALCAYAGGVGRDQWLHLVDVAADMTGAVYSGATSDVIGITDGSNAPTGIVGEIQEVLPPPPYVPVTVAAKSNNAASANWTVACSLTLAAGDWDLSASARFVGPTPLPMSNMLMCHAVISTSPSAPLPATGYIGAEEWMYRPLETTWAITTGNLAAKQRNSSSTVTWYLNVAMEDAVGPMVSKIGQAMGYLHARRIR